HGGGPRGTTQTVERGERDARGPSLPARSDHAAAAAGPGAESADRGRRQMAENGGARRTPRRWLDDRFEGVPRGARAARGDLLETRRGPERRPGPLHFRGPRWRHCAETGRARWLARERESRIRRALANGYALSG